MRRIPGSHPPNINNRSSKQLGSLCGPGHKSVFRCMSNEELVQMDKDLNANKSSLGRYYQGCIAAEQKRRKDKKEKKAQKA